MRFEINIANYQMMEIPSYILEVDVNSLDFYELEMEIEEFNKEIKWDDMWNINQAKDRLLNGWKLVIFRPDIVRGWIWLDNTNEPRNIYINKNFRNKGVGKQMYFAMLNICKRIGMERVEGSVDDWNLSSIKCIKNAGWNECLK